MTMHDDADKGHQRRDFLKLASGGALASLAAGAGLATAAGLPALAPNNSSIQHYRFGVNLVPSRDWYYVYNAWHIASLERDLDQVAALGADHIRLMVVWPWFQTNPRTVSQTHLDRLDELVRAAAKRGLDVMPCIYTGWLSGFRFDPAFYHDKPFYTAPEWAAAQQVYLAALSKRMAKHPNFMGFDIGNEIGVNWTTKHIPDADAWMKRVFSEMHAQAPGKIHVNGVDHQPFFLEHTFSPQALVAQQELVPLHCWPYWTGANKRGGPLDRPYTHLPAAMTALVHSYAGRRDKPVWIQEFGVCDVEMPEKDIPRYMETAIHAAIEEGAGWFTWWASHDVNKRYEFHPFEYGLGLIDADNKIKEQGRMFRRIAEQYRGKPVKFRSGAAPAMPRERNHEATWAWLLRAIEARS